VRGEVLGVKAGNAAPHPYPANENAADRLWE